MVPAPPGVVLKSVLLGLVVLYCRGLSGELHAVPEDHLVSGRDGPAWGLAAAAAPDVDFLV